MTLPTIKFGEIAGRHYAEFTPSEPHPVRLYGDTQEEAQQAAWEFLEEDDRAHRANKPAEVKQDALQGLMDIAANMNEEIRALCIAFEYIEREIDRMKS